MSNLFQSYCDTFSATLAAVDWGCAKRLGVDLEKARSERRQVFLCGNGGSAANGLHWANDLIYGAGKTGRGGLRAHALSVNPSVCSCLANDLGYDRVFSEQLGVLGSPGDLLIVFSGSGNSPNILHALETARSMGIRSWAVLGFDGGKALKAADNAVHFEVNDMQIAEDCQMVLGHAVTRMLAGEE
ncbi:MAG: SIS domain-containing protein [Verrucomicrobiota bacterium]